MKYDFDKVIERRDTPSMKWNGGSLVSNNVDKNTLALFTADMDFMCAEPIIKAMHEVADFGIFGYSTPVGMPQYYQSVTNWFKRRHDWEFSEDSICFINGTLDAIKIAIRAYTDKGDKVLITRPVYPPFTYCIEEEKRIVENSPLINEDGYYTMDFEDIEKKAQDPKVKMFLLCNPHNPVGRVWSLKELIRLSEICERNHVVLVSDEVHCDLLRRGVKFTTVAKAGSKDNTVVLTAINKTFNCAGLKCTHVVIQDQELMNKFKQSAGWVTTNPFSVAATMAAYNEGEEWLEQLIDYLDETMNWVIEYVKNNMPGVKVYIPEGTYVLWMDFRGLGLSAEELHERIFKKCKVILEDGEEFDPDGGAGFLRICLPSPRSIIQEAFERIARELY